MMLVKVRTGDAKFRLLEPGVYNGIIDVSEREQRTSQNGNPYVRIHIKVVDEHGRQLTRVPFNLNLQGDGVGFTLELLRAAGIEFDENAEEITLDVRSLANRRVRVRLGHDEYQGRLRNVVTAVMPPTSSAEPATATASEGGGRPF